MSAPVRRARDEDTPIDLDFMRQILPGRPDSKLNEWLSALHREEIRFLVDLKACVDQIKHLSLPLLVRGKLEEICAGGLSSIPEANINPAGPPPPPPPPAPQQKEPMIQRQPDPVLNLPPPPAAHQQPFAAAAAAEVVTPPAGARDVAGSSEAELLHICLSAKCVNLQNQMRSRPAVTAWVWHLLSNCSSSKSLRELSIDPHGNYICQLLVEWNPVEVVPAMWAALRGDQLIELCCQRFSSGVLQKLLLLGSPEIQHEIVGTIVASNDDALARLVYDASGNYVVQRMLESNSSRILLPRLWNLIRGRVCHFSCICATASCIVQKLVFSSSRAQPDLLHELILEMCADQKQLSQMAMHPQGNFVVQNVITSASDDDISVIERTLRPVLEPLRHSGQLHTNILAKLDGRSQLQQACSQKLVRPHQQQQQQQQQHHHHHHHHHHVYRHQQPHGKSNYFDKI